MTTRKNSIFNFITLDKLFTIKVLYKTNNLLVHIIIKIQPFKKILYNYFAIDMFFKIYLAGK